MYPATHGTKQSESRLPDSVIMVSEQMKTAGIATATFLANGYVSDKFGFNQGWDYYGHGDSHLDVVRPAARPDDRL